jgi:N-acetylglutamate synthase-like GNAT family acetyltransferase
MNDWTPRVAREKDISALEELIPISVRKLHEPYYSVAQIEAAIGPVFGVDSQLIRDGTYFVVEHDGILVGCGGWSKRQTLYGGDRERSGADEELDPRRDAARIRAFFIHPRWARRGIGRSILSISECTAINAGFRKAELVATLAGEPLYAACGYSVAGRHEPPLTGGLTLPVVVMTKSWERV